MYKRFVCKCGKSAVVKIDPNIPHVRPQCDCGSRMSEG